jgi:hypothetical protein
MKIHAGIPNGVVCPSVSTSSVIDEANRIAETAVTIHAARCIAAGCQRDGRRPRSGSSPAWRRRPSAEAAPKNTSITISARATSSAQFRGCSRK